MTCGAQPTPEVTPKSEEYWTAAEGYFLLPACQECDLIYHYPRALCPDCFSDNVDWIESGSPGEVDSYSAARTMSGWREEDLPLVVVCTELDEGPRMMTNTRADLDEASIGTQVRVEFVDSEDSNVSIPLFVSIEE